VYPFEYVKAASLKQAAELLAVHPDARPLSGGMTLIPTLKARLAQPTHLVDIGQLAELRGIERKGDTLVIGAATRHAEVCASDVVRKALPALAYLAERIGDPQVRNLGTMGGSIANNDPAADYPAAVLALNATIVTNTREIEADDFFQGTFATALEPGEIVTRLVYPLPKRAAYEKFPHPASGYAMAGVFVAETAQGVRVAVTGAGAGVFRWTEAEAALARNMSADALDALTVASDDLNEDMHGSREYRAQLVKVMAQRAVAKLIGS
jgi:carbon-monoxide dehydrogenase medium subunit